MFEDVVTMPFDIETIPSQEGWVREFVKETIKPPASMKKEDTIQDWWDNKSEQAIEDKIAKMAFDGGACHVIHISHCFDEGEVVGNTINDVKDEKDLISGFFDVLKRELSPMDVVAGHNIIGFDLRILKQRAMVLGVEIPRTVSFNAKKWDNNPFDTMLQWDSQNFVKLDYLCKVFGVDDKGLLDGSDVYPLWQAKNYKAIHKYGCHDTNITRQLFRKMVGLQSSKKKSKAA